MDFANKIVKISQNYKEIKFVFDRYITCLLKSQTKKCMSGNEIRYHIAEDTNIEDILILKIYC